MNRWHGKVAVVTGASSGIGEAIVKDLIKNQLIVIGLARRLERMKDNQKQLPQNQQNNYHPIKCDVSNEDEVKNVFQLIEKNFGGVDILINNAGMYKRGLLTDPDNIDNIKQTINLNVMGVVYCTSEAFKSMKKRNVAGHVVLINSIAGHKVVKLPGIPFEMNIYSPTKFAITSMTEIYRTEFMDQNTNVKITSISPGVVDTEIIGDEQKSIQMPMLKSEDISDAVMYVLGTPPHVQIHELTIKPVGERL